MSIAKEQRLVAGGTYLVRLFESDLRLLPPADPKLGDMITLIAEQPENRIRIAQDFGQCALFKGNGWIEVPVSSIWNMFNSMTTTYTLEFYVKRVAHNNESYASSMQNASNFWNIFMDNRDGFGLELQLMSGGSNHMILRGGDIPVGEWAHVLFIKVGAVCGFYVNGKQTAYQTLSSTASVSAGMEIGRFNAGSYYKGCMDDFRMVMGNPYGLSPQVDKSDSFIVSRKSLPEVPSTKLRMNFQYGVQDASDNNVQVSGHNVVLTQNNCEQVFLKDVLLSEPGIYTFTYGDGKWLQDTMLIQGSSMAICVGGTNNLLEHRTIQSIDYVHITSFSDSKKFGDLDTRSAQHSQGSASSSTTMFTLAGKYYPSPQVNETWYRSSAISSIRFALGARVSHFGNLTYATTRNGGMNDSVRAFSVGGDQETDNNSIETINAFYMGSGSDAIDFGDMSTSMMAGAVASCPTCGLSLGGYYRNNPSNAAKENIQRLVFASNGSMANIGSLRQINRYAYGTGNSINAFIFGGSGTGYYSVVDYVSFASPSSSSLWGDLTKENIFAACTCNPQRAVYMGGANLDRSSIQDVGYLDLTSQGAVAEFGTLTEGRYSSAGGSDSHGGLQ